MRTAVVTRFLGVLGLGVLLLMAAAVMFNGAGPGTGRQAAARGNPALGRRKIENRAHRGT